MTAQPILGYATALLDDSWTSTIIPGIGTIEQIASNFFFLAAVLIVSWIASKLVNRWVFGIVQRRSKEKQVEEALKRLYERLVWGLVLFIAILAILSHFRVDITSLVAVLGIGGIAVAFAAQETIANWIAGFILLVDKPFRIGDYIALDTEGLRAGTVVDIGLRSTRVKTKGNTLITIPNAEFTKRDIYNYTSNNDRKIKAYVSISIGYDNDVDKARKVLASLCKNVPGVLDKPDKPEVIVSGLGSHSVDLKLKVWIADAFNKLEIESALYEKILKEFRKNRIEIPYPKQTIFLKR